MMIFVTVGGLYALAYLDDVFPRGRTSRMRILRFTPVMPPPRGVQLPPDTASSNVRSCRRGSRRSSRWRAKHTCDRCRGMSSRSLLWLYSYAPRGPVMHSEARESDRSKTRGPSLAPCSLTPMSAEHTLRAAFTDGAQPSAVPFCPAQCGGAHPVCGNLRFDATARPRPSCWSRRTGGYSLRASAATHRCVYRSRSHHESALIPS